MSTKYQDEGDLFWTFFSYVSKCFAPNNILSGNSTEAQSFENCYDWSTVLIKDIEEVDALNKCVDESFSVPKNFTTDNVVLNMDRKWAAANHIMVHPSVTINNITYTNSTG